MQNDKKYKKQNVAILCGGKTYEHEVSVISGLQIAENIDRSLYRPYFFFLDKNDQIFLIKNLKSRKDFYSKKRIKVDIQKISSSLTFKPRTFAGRSISIDLCYLAFHGGTGESGQVQGLLEFLKVPFTGPDQEGAVIVMNKALTKEVLSSNKVQVLPWFTIRSNEYSVDKKSILAKITSELQLPLIIKPVHLGSSIGIDIAKTPIELEQKLSIATRTDSEVLVEPALSDFTEYNVSVRSADGKLEFSPIEEPKRDGEVLSFDDKYSGGAKKTSGGGMELLDRTVPANISTELKAEIVKLAKKVYQACRLSGLVRIDFLYTEGKLYCTEINPIPGSLSFYLWEAGGETFQEQITQALEDTNRRFNKKITVKSYDTNILEKFTT